MEIFIVLRQSARDFVLCLPLVPKNKGHKRKSLMALTRSKNTNLVKVGVNKALFKAIENQHGHQQSKSLVVKNLSDVSLSILQSNTSFLCR